MTENEQLKALTKNEKRYLSRRGCGLCEQFLDRPGCSSIYGGCTERERVDRRERCLKQYKPRKQ